jgi:VRR-NUC domain
MGFTQADLIAMEARLARGRKPVETPEAGGCDRESKLHEQTVQELRRRRVYFVHSRMDRPSTNNVGTPDFIVAMPNGKTLWLELKTATGKLSPEQQTAQHLLKTACHEHHIVRSYKQLLDVLG